MAKQGISGAIGTAALALALAWTGGARAEEGVLMKDLLGSMGLIARERPAIEYRERAPLVVPPRLELREPVRGSVEASNPQWPNDPDVVARKRREADARVPVTETERRRLATNPTLSIDEIRAGRRPGAEVPSAPVVRHGDNSREATWVNPDQLRAPTRKVEEASGPEPARRTLTQPPTGLRAPAAGAPVVANSEPDIKEDETDPKVFQRQQARR